MLEKIVFFLHSYTIIRADRGIKVILSMEEINCIVRLVHLYFIFQRIR